MSFNLCNRLFGVTVSTSSVCSEGYGPENLLESGQMPANRSGFMAERFIKPPVEVIFSFPMRFEIKDVFIDPKVGNQKSCGFEIQTASYPVVTNEQDGSDGKNLSKEVVFQTVGKSPWECADLILYHFVNHRYQQKLNMKQCILPQSSWTCLPCDARRFALKHQFSKFLLEVTHLKVRIFRTSNGSIPCLRRIEIRGQPSYTCKKHEIDEFRNKVRLLSMKNEEIKQQIPTIENANKSEEQLSAQASSQDDLFPEDFKDALTFDLMTMPVILPSGHTIDQTTLDKHIAAEAQWGRPPSDPFTGLLFTDASKPLPNLLLKSRVDKFLLNSGRKFEHLPRSTIGISANGNCKARMMQTDELKYEKDTQSTCTSNSPFQDDMGLAANIRENNFLRGASQESVKTNIPASSKLTMPPPLRCNRKRMRTDSPVMRKRSKAQPTQHVSSAGTSHEDIIHDSLKDTLNSNVARLPTFGESLTTITNQNGLKNENKQQCHSQSSGDVTEEDFIIPRCTFSANSFVQTAERCSPQTLMIEHERESSVRSQSQSPSPRNKQRGKSLVRTRKHSQSYPLQKEHEGKTKDAAKTAGVMRSRIQTQGSHGPQMLSREEVIRDSLTDALNSTLAKLPTFGNDQVFVPRERKIACMKCGGESAESRDGTSVHLYRSPCRHIYCRICLQRSQKPSSSVGDKYSCIICGSEFSSKDVTRIHDTTGVSN